MHIVHIVDPTKKLLYTTVCWCVLLKAVTENTAVWRNAASARFCATLIVAVNAIHVRCSGLGFSMVITNLMIVLFYNVIVAWCVYYLFASMTSQLPWQTCGNEWNTPFCMETTHYRNLTGRAALCLHHCTIVSSIFSLW